MYIHNINKAFFGVFIICILLVNHLQKCPCPSVPFCALLLIVCKYVTMHAKAFKEDSSSVNEAPCMNLVRLLIFVCLICRCCECGASLSHWYYEKDNRLFCQKDYWAKFGELCHGCSEPITTGLIMVSPNRPKPNLCRLSPAVSPVTPFSTIHPVTAKSCKATVKSCYL